MTQEQIEQLLAEALPRTSAKQAELSFVVRDSSDWVIVLVHRGEELALRVAETPESTPESVREEMIRRLRILF